MISQVDIEDWDVCARLDKSQALKVNKSLKAPSAVEHPPHYNQGSVECIVAIQAALSPEEFRGYCKGNALKYVWREQHKAGIESLQKAQWYLNRLVGETPNGRA
jgi:hypothetical protein